MHARCSSRRVRQVLVSVLAGVSVASCGSAGSTTSGSPTTVATVTTVGLPADPIRAALQSGSTYLASRLGEIDPASLAIVDFLARAFHLTALDPALGMARDAPMPDEPEIALMMRLVDPESPMPALPEGYDEMDFTYMVMVRALHCDQEPLPADWMDTAAALADAGDYELAHYAYALSWVGDLDCQVSGLDQEVDRVGTRLLARLVRPGEPLTDEHLTLGAGLSALGRGDLLPDDFVERVLDGQRSDGGWPRDPGTPESDWHPTGLAIWILGTAASGQDLPSMLVWA